MAFARAGLLGNPSDGYEGKVLACPVRNFRARVEVASADRVTITASTSPVELSDLSSVLERSIPAELNGLERLVLAAIRRFARSLKLDDPMRTGVAVTCATTIPRQVGLAGSSAVIIATIRALSRLWSAPIGDFDLAEMALATEVEDLGIAAGPMDRVIQAHERVMLLDLAPPRTGASYEHFDARLLPRLVIVWDPRGGESSDVTHSDLRARWLRGDDDVVVTMNELRALVDSGVEALRRDDADGFADLVDHNFDLRCRVTTPTERDHEMVALARGAGAAAKLCGSGGAILVVPRQGVTLSSIERVFLPHGFRTCQPEIG